MGKGIVAIGVAAETGQFSKDIASGVVKPLEDAQSTISELANSTSTSSDKIEAALAAQQRATQQNARTHQQATRQIQTDNNEQVASFELSQREQNRIQKETLKAGAGAVAASLAQTAQGFDGTVNGALETGTNISATLGSVLPGPFAALATVATLAFGVVAGLFQKSADDSKQFKSDVDDLGQTLIKAGNAGKVAFSDVVDELATLAKESDDTLPSLEKLDQSAKRSGNSYRALAQAYAGAGDRLRSLITTGKTKLAQDEEAQRVAQRQTVIDAQTANTSIAQQDADFKVRDGIVKKTKAQSDYNTYVEQAEKKYKAAAKEEHLWVEAGGPEMQEMADRTKDLDGWLTDAGSDLDAFIKKGNFNPAAYVKAMDAEIKAVKAYNTELDKSHLSTAAKEYLDSLPQADAQALLAGYDKQAPAMKTHLNKIWTDLGKANTGTYSKVFENTTVKAPKVDTPTLTPAQIKQFQTDVQRKFNKSPLSVTVNYKVGKRVT